MTTSLTILLVQDQPESNSPLLGVLEEEGHAVICCRSGMDALLKLQLARPSFDLLITDHAIPGAFDGLEFVRAARAKGLQTPVIVTADRFTSQLILGYESLSILGLLASPYDLGLLRSLLRSVALRPAQRPQPVAARVPADPWRTVAT